MSVDAFLTSTSMVVFAATTASYAATPSLNTTKRAPQWGASSVHAPQPPSSTEW